MSDVSNISNVIDTVLTVNYNDATLIRQKTLLRNFKPIFVDSTISPNSFDYTNLFSVLQKLKSPVSTTLIPIVQSIQELQNDKKNSIEYERREFSLIQDKETKSPFSLMIQTLPSEEAYSCIYVFHLIRLFIFILQTHYEAYNSLPDDDRILYREHVGSFLKFYSGLFDTHAPLMIRHLLLDESTFQSFRSSVYKALTHSDLQKYIFGNTDTVEKHLYSLLKQSIDNPILSSKINIYIRYIKQFIHAPFQSQFRGVTKMVTISDIEKLEADVFVEPKYIKELQEERRQQVQRRRPTTYDWWN